MVVRICCLNERWLLLWPEFDLTFNKVEGADPLNDLITMLSFFLQDQFDNLEKHTQWGIEYLEKYTKFVKERSEIEINYAKQIRWVVEMTCDPYCGLQGLHCVPPR